MEQQRKNKLLRQAELLFYSKAGLDRQMEHLEKTINEIKREEKNE